MSEKPEHILTLLDAQIAVEKRNVARFEREGWAEPLAEARQALHELELLYDIVDEGLIDALKADYSAVQLVLAGVPA